MEGLGAPSKVQVNDEGNVDNFKKAIKAEFPCMFHNVDAPSIKL